MKETNDPTRVEEVFKRLVDPKVGSASREEVAS